MENKRIDFLRDKLISLPKLPGVYIMKDKNHKIIYIGKAKSIKNRVSQYFNGEKLQDVKVCKMVSCVYDFDYIITDSEFEALILECSLIKQNNPKYNILLKDDKGYNYIEITGGEYRKIRAVFNKDENSKSVYIGPFTSSYVVRNTVDLINDAFMLPTCNRVFPRDFNKQRPCLNFYIKKCSGVCNGNIELSDYESYIDKAVDFLKNKSSDIFSHLKSEMLDASENLNFEKAALYRDKIEILSRVRESQKVVLKNKVNQDVIACAFGNSTVVINIMKFRNGLLIDKVEFLFYNEDNVDTVRNSFLSMYYTRENDIPNFILVDSYFEDLDLLSKLLSEKANKTVQILVPKKGDRFKIVMMVLKNAKDKLDAISKRQDKKLTVLKELQDILGLKNTPLYIESYDISNLGNDDIVGSMVVFKDGKPYKKGYRRFSIKRNIQDDYAAMNEMINRRFKKLMDKDPSFITMPDLILVDGGKGHVSVVNKSVENFDLNIPVFGMVKDNKHKTSAISYNSSIIDIKFNKSVFKLITEIQNEVHRFAITYQRLKAKSRNINLQILDVEGIGQKKAENLLRHFKSLDKINKSSVDEICAVKGISKKDALNIKKYFSEHTHM